MPVALHGNESAHRNDAPAAAGPEDGSGRFADALNGATASVAPTPPVTDKAAPRHSEERRAAPPPTHAGKHVAPSALEVVPAPVVPLTLEASTTPPRRSVEPPGATRIAVLTAASSARRADTSALVAPALQPRAQKTTAHQVSESGRAAAEAPLGVSAREAPGVPAGPGGAPNAALPGRTAPANAASAARRGASTTIGSSVLGTAPARGRSDGVAQAPIQHSSHADRASRANDRRPAQSPSVPVAEDVASVALPPTAPTVATAHASGPATTAALPGVASQLLTVLQPLRHTSAGGQTLTIALHPEGIGDVKATMTLNDGSLVVRLSPTTPAAADALRQALPDLQSGMRQDTGQTTVVLSDSSGQSSGGQFAGAQSSGAQSSGAQSSGGQFAGGSPGNGRHADGQTGGFAPAGAMEPSSRGDAPNGLYPRSLDPSTGRLDVRV